MFSAILPISAQESSDSETIGLSDRVLIASQLYGGIQLYFGHWKGLPSDFDLEKQYAAYVNKIIASDRRLDFDLASMEFLASLQNGHSGFSDKWMRDKFGQRIGLYAYPIDDERVITRSSVSELGVGEIIDAIEGEPFDMLYQRNRKCISGSNDRWRRRAFFEYSYLFPLEFTITLKSGGNVIVTRAGEFQWAGAEYDSTQTSVQHGIAVLRVPAFVPTVGN